MIRRSVPFVVLEAWWESSCVQAFLASPEGVGGALLLPRTRGRGAQEPLHVLGRELAAARPTELSSECRHGDHLPLQEKREAAPPLSDSRARPWAARGVHTYGARTAAPLASGERNGAKRLAARARTPVGGRSPPAALLGRVHWLDATPPRLVTTHVIGEGQDLVKPERPAFAPRDDPQLVGLGQALARREPMRRWASQRLALRPAVSRG